MAECLSKTIHISSSLDRVGVPKPRKEQVKLRRGSILSERFSGTAENSKRMSMTVRPVMTKGKSNWMLGMLSVLNDSDSD